MWAIIAVLAILKTGGAFLPLDLAAPHGRLESIIDEAGADIMLCSQDNLAKYSDLVDRRDRCRSICGWQQRQRRSTTVRLDQPHRRPAKYRLHYLHVGQYGEAERHRRRSPGILHRGLIALGGT
jgi:non-ribosomal peptide synthetase component F